MKDSSDLIKRLRLLRDKERLLRSTLVADMRAFQERETDLSFFTLPISNHDGISVASTATALMALIDCGELDKWKPEDKHAKTVTTPIGADAEQKPVKSDQKADAKERSTETESEKISSAPPKPETPKELFARVVATTWKSSGLPDLNAFTTCMVVRATGFLVSVGALTRKEAEDLRHLPTSKETGGKEKSNPSVEHKEVSGAIGKAVENKKDPTLLDVVNAVASEAPESFRISTYPPKATMAYWFVDGITKAGINIDDDAWRKIARWAVAEFDAQLRYLASDNDPLMDPPSLAMSAALLERLRKTFHNSPGLSHLIGGCGLPGQVELTHAVDEVFRKQTATGIWHKYFPLFHFPKSGAADYTFSFEFLEAILLEFSDTGILARRGILDRIETAVRWCEDNRFEYRKCDELFSGWNAGGDVNNLAAGMPEAWATASVHMFLWELESALSTWLQKLVLSRASRTERPNPAKWAELIDVDLTIAPNQSTTLKDTIFEELLKPARSATAESSDGWDGPLQRLRNSPERILRQNRLKRRVSALLFGPPGTSKTSIARALAGQLGWPLIIVTPSDFLSNGLEQIYVRATEIFDDLMDLSAVIVLFDEMDALAQTRANSALDVTRQLLTTSMLPKLADLHDRAQVIFLMATNHKKDLDPAITRPGRFDLLLCVGPPNWPRKLQGLGVVLKNLEIGDSEETRKLLGKYSDSPATKEQLDLFTVGDFRSFVESLKRSVSQKTLEAALKDIVKAKFQQQVNEWTHNYITLSQGGTRSADAHMGALDEFKRDKEDSKIQ